MFIRKVECPKGFCARVEIDAVDVRDGTIYKGHEWLFSQAMLDNYINFLNCYCKVNNVELSIMTVEGRLVSRFITDDLEDKDSL